MGHEYAVTTLCSNGVIRLLLKKPVTSMPPTGSARLSSMSKLSISSGETWISEYHAKMPATELSGTPRSCIEHRAGPDREVPNNQRQVVMVHRGAAAEQLDVLLGTCLVRLLHHLHGPAVYAIVMTTLPTFWPVSTYS